MPKTEPKDHTIPEGSTPLTDTEGKLIGLFRALPEDRRLAFAKIMDRLARDYDTEETEETL